MGAELGLDRLLRLNGIDYATVLQPPAASRASRQVVCDCSGAVPLGHIARPVLLSDRHGEGIAVIPADRRIDLHAIATEFGRRFRVVAPCRGRDSPALATNGEEPQIETFVDQSLVQLPWVYLKTMIPSRLAKVDGEAFRSLFYGTWCGHISRPRS